MSNRAGTSELHWDYSIIPMDLNNDQSPRVPSSPITAVAIPPSLGPNEVFICDAVPMKSSYILRSLRIEDFKSYSGVFEISPFPISDEGQPLICVVGPNGSGKSNLMDAVAFCFNCADSTKLRGNGSSSNLISRCSRSGGSCQPACASVSVTLSKTEGTLEGDITFKRTVSSRGDSKYLINGKHVSLEVYREAMQGCGLDIKGSFLIFQGDVESLALADPAELGAVFDRVSGSADSKKDFEINLKRKQGLECEYAKLAGRKRQLLAERKKVKNELVEIQKIDDLLVKKAKRMDEFFLTKLWLIDQEAENIPQCENSAMRDPEEIQAEVKQAEQEVEKAKGERAKSDLRNSKYSRKLLVEEADLRKLDSEISDYRMQMDINEKRIEKICALSDTRRTKEAAVKNKLVQVEGQIKTCDSEVEAEAKTLERLIATGEGEDLDAEKDRGEIIPFLRRNGYTGEEVEFRRKLSKFRNLEIPIKLGDMFDAVKQVDKDIQFVEEAKRGLESKRAELSEQLEKNELNERLVKEKVETLENAISEKSLQLKKLEKDLSLSKSIKLKQKLEKLFQNKKALLDELSDIKESEAEVARERVLRETLSQLTSKFGNDQVFGRVVDLVAPADPRLGPAVETAAGKYLDAVLVRNVKAARDAVNWLKSEKLPSLSFIPVEDVVVPPRLSPSEDYVLSSDCVTIKSYCSDSEQLIKRGISFVFGETVVCESLSDARRVAFSSNLFASVVTVGGERISGNGNITVGGATGGNSGSSRFKQKNVHEISAKLDQFDKEIVAVTEDLRREELASEKVVAEIRKIELELSSAKSLLESLKLEFVRLNDSIRTIAEFLIENTADVAKKRSEIDSLISKKTESLSRLKETVIDLSREFLFSFFVSDGVVDYSVDTDLLVAIGGSMNDPSLSLKSRLEEAKKGQREKIEKLEKSLNSLRAEQKCLLLDLNELSDSAQLDLDESTARKSLANSERLIKQKEEAAEIKRSGVSKLRAEIEELKNFKSKTEAEIRVKISRIQSLKQELVEAQIVASKVEKSAARVQNLKVQVLKDAVIHSAYIPLKLAPEDLATGPQEEVCRKIIESLFVSLSSVLPFTSQQDQTAAAEEEDSMASLIEEVISKIDFEPLPSEVKRRATLMCKKGRSSLFLCELERDWKQALKDIESEIESIGGVKRSSRNGGDNLLDQIDLDLKQVSSEGDRIKSNLNSCSEELKRLRFLRNEQFIKCFRFVSKKVDELYKLLTNYTSDVSTASASLDLEMPVTVTSDLTSVEAFNSGIIFSLMPPYKRYTNIELLSGGEKTVAAVALQFALLAYSAPPFSMVDEIDAALDSENVNVLARFMKKAVPQQLIVISLKEKLYANADCLVGVYKDSHTNGSGLVTLDLRPYPDGDERKEEYNKPLRGPLMTPAPNSAPVTSRREGRVVAGGA